MLLWVADHAVRIARASSMVEVQGACLKAGGDVVELSYLIQGGGSWNLTDPRGRATCGCLAGDVLAALSPLITHEYSNYDRPFAVPAWNGSIRFLERPCDQSP